MPDNSKLLTHWLPVFLWCAIIFAQSAFATPDIGPHWPYMDKFAHLGIYGLLAVLLCRALHAGTHFSGRPLKLALTVTVLTALYGLSDEWHQSFVPARNAEAADLLADLLGGVMGSGVYLLIQRISSLWTGRKSLGVE